MQLINDYKLVAKIGKGSYGEVWKASHINKKKNVAIKIEKKNSKNILKYETLILRYLKDLNCVVNSKYYGETESFNFLVMEILNKQVDEYYNDLILKNKDKINLIKKIGLQMLHCIENIHILGIIHRDIKPGNFLIDDSVDKLKLIDFGLSKQYIDSNGIHKKNKTHENIIGTLRYISVNIHAGYEPSRRDDLISMIYILLYLFLGKLPWQGIIASSLREKEIKINNKKIEFSKEIKLNKNIPEKFIEVYNYVHSLSYDETPSYDFISFLFKTIKEIT